MKVNPRDISLNSKLLYKGEPVIVTNIAIAPEEFGGVRLAVEHKDYYECVTGKQQYNGRNFGEDKYVMPGFTYVSFFIDDLEWAPEEKT